MVLPFDLRQQIKDLAIPLGVCPTFRENPLQLLQLRKPDGREQIAQTIVVTDLFMLIPGERFTTLLTALPRPRGNSRIVRDNRPAARGRDDLIAVEGIDGGNSCASRRTALLPRANRLGRIVHVHGPVLFAKRRDGIVVTASSVEIDTENQETRAPACLGRGSVGPGEIGESPGQE